MLNAMRPDPVPGETAVPSPVLRTLVRNLVAAVRLALFLPVRAGEFRATPGDLIALSAFNLAGWLLAAALHAGFPGTLDPVVVAGRCGNVAAVLVAAWSIAALARTPSAMLHIATALIAVDTVLEAIAPALFMLASGPALLLFWKWAVTLRAVVVCSGARGPERLQGWLVATVLAAGLAVWPGGNPWYDAEEGNASLALTKEEVFHRQGELIEAALGGVAPGRPGVPELYFVGFAPDGSQDVFLREMRSVRKLLDERFGTQGRSVVLANGEEAVWDYPIASATNLRRVLERVAQRMNADEDAVFIYLSAHGGEDHLLSAWQPPLDLEPLGPTALARMLSDAGIRWRVIVVSACYSGGFIEPLKDDNTLIVTASSADRNSFGCESGQDFTWFGRAYFADALAQTRSFVDAYTLALNAVARQEAAEGLEASLPQLWVGPAIRARLAEWEAERNLTRDGAAAR